MFAGSVASLTVLGAPDLILLTLSEFAEQAHRICRAGNLPLLVDADHGYGNALNVKRTVEELENAITELTTQKQGECYSRIKDPNDTGDPFIAEVPRVTFPTPDPEKEEEFRRASAAAFYMPTEEIETARQERIKQWLDKPQYKPDEIWEQTP